MFKCPNKNLPEWKELEKTVPEVAYTIWDMNNGHGIDKAPNGEPSILFQDLLKQFNDNRAEAINAKAKIFSDDFRLNISKLVLDLNNEPYLNDVLPASTVDFKLSEFSHFTEDEIRTITETSDLYTKIQKGLKDRLNAIKRYSSKNPKVWRQLLTLILKLTNSEVELGMLEFILHVNDTIEESIKFLSKDVNDINTRQISQLNRDYVGFYKPLIDSLLYLIDTTDLFKDSAEYKLVRSLLSRVATLLNNVNNRFINLRKSKGYSMLRLYLRELRMPDSMILQTINWLDDPKHDSNMFMNWFGMATNSNNAVVQAIAKMLNDTKNATDRLTMEVGIKLTKTLNAAKAKYGNDVLKLLYEKLDDGTYSGLRVKPVNYGQLKKDQLTFLNNLAKKLGIDKDQDGKYNLPQNEDIQRKWFDAITLWNAKHVNKKYKAEYYTLRNKMLSSKTRDAINEIQLYIDNIVSPITVDGIQYTNLLSEAEYNQLELLRKQKKLLANPYNLDGSPKTGDDALIASELSLFNEEVSKHINYEVDRDAFNKDRAKVAYKYGEGSDELKTWEERNTRQRYTEEFYKRLRNLVRFELSPDYEDMVKRRRLIHDLYKDPHTGKIDVHLLSDSERAQLLLLDLTIADLYEIAPKEDRSDLEDRFDKFAISVENQLYYDDMNAAREQGTEAYNKWFNANHYENKRGMMVAASYYTEVRPNEEFYEQYTEIVPSGKYTKIDPSSDWYNSDWDENGPALQPNKKLYDNSKAYNEMVSKPEVKQLYDEIELIMQEATQYVSFLTMANDSRMPQIPARFLLALSRKDGIMAKLGYAFDDLVTTKEDDLDFVEEFATMPNGDPIKVIPTRFIKMLEDPNTISTDAVASVILYYNMAVNYKNMSLKLDDIELLLNLLKLTTIRTRNEIRGPGATNVYKLAQLLVDRLLYGRNKSPIMTNVLGKEINMGKTLDIIRGFVTKVNLSGNLWSIGTSFFTDTTYTTMEAAMGRHFDVEDLRFAQSEFTRHLPDMMANIGNPVPKGRLPYLLMLNLVVKENRELFDRLDLSLTLRAINQNFWFAGYTQSDYTVKSHTLLSIYHSYRFVPEVGFMNKQQFIERFYPNDVKLGLFKFKELTTTLLDAYVEDNNGDVSVDPKYKEFVSEKLLNDVRNKINIISRRIDGTIREVDKAGIHANAIASYLVLHRNFMVSALLDRFKGRQFNLDLGVMEEGYYRSTGRFLKNVINDRHFALTQLLADYDNLEEYELYAIRRVLYELALIAASTSVAIGLSTMVDGDDEYDTWISQSITYLAMRSAFEFRTMYNPFELISLIKSPTAAFNWFDNISSFINIINPASYTGDRTPFTIIDRGVYKGMPVIFKNIIKVTPFKSAFEARDPKVKRDYLQNQLMNF